MIRLVNRTDGFTTGTSGTVTIPATTAGNVLIILAITSAGTGAQWTAPNHISTTDGNFTEVAYYSLPGQGGALWDWGTIAGSSTSSDILYQVTSGGVTAVNWNASIAPDAITVLEYSGLVTPVVVDDFEINGSASGTVVGSALTGSGANDLCFENFATFGYNIAGTLPPWAQDYSLNDYGGSGALLQVGASGTQPAPQGVNSSGSPVTDKYTCTAVAFKGVGSAPTTAVDESGNPVTIKYAWSDNFNFIVGRFVDTTGNIHSFGPLFSNDYSGSFDFANSVQKKGGGLDCAWGMSLVGQTDLYVVDQCLGAGTLWHINIATGFTTMLAGNGTNHTLMNAPGLQWDFQHGLYSCILGLDGNIYINDVNRNDILCYNIHPSSITVCGITIPPGNVAVITGSDIQGYRADYGVAADAAGNVYTTDEHDSLIYKTDPSGVAVAVVGNGTAANTGDGGPALSASIWNPQGLALDQNNILYIACVGNPPVTPGSGAVRAVNFGSSPQVVCGQTIAPGTIETLVALPAQSDLWAVQPDYTGNVLVGDVYAAGSCSPTGSHGWMHIIGSGGAYSLYSGTGVCGLSGDGGPAGSALIGVAFGVSVPLPAATFCGGMTSQAVGNPLI